MQNEEISVMSTQDQASLSLRKRLARHPWLQWLKPPVRYVRESIEKGKSKAACFLSVTSLAANARWFRRHGQQRIPATAPAVVNPQIVMLASSYLPADPRIEREARSLAAAGFRVKVLCPSWNADPNVPTVIPNWGEKVSIRLLPFWSSLAGVSFPSNVYSLYYPWVYHPLLLRAALEETDVWAFHTHDLDTAFAGLMAAAHKQVPCVCDFHEWYSENITYDPRDKIYKPHSARKRKMYQWMERIVLHSASRVITVCDSIARELEQQYKSPRPVTVVRNIPILKSPDTALQPTINLRETLGLEPTTKILLYQGGVGPSRALEPVIQAMAHVKKAVLVIRGPFIENYSKAFLELAEQSGSQNRVFCLPAVPGARCVAEAKAADMGLCTLLSICKNFRLALPNKIFEYLSAGLPLLCPGYPEIRRIVETYQVGLCFDHDDPLSIANAINRFAEDDTIFQSCRDNIPAALQDLRADSEWAKLTTLYKEIGEGKKGECVVSVREAA